MIAPIPMADYLAMRGVSWSTLSKMGESPLAYKDALENPKEPTAAMVLGSAIHTAVLEPELFDITYTYYDGTHNGYDWESVKAGAQAAGMTVLSVSEWQQCMGAAEAVWVGTQGREARRVLHGCRREVTLRWVDPVTHIRCKARPDLVRYHRVPVVDLADVKTTAAVDARKFGRIAADLGYHGKMAFAIGGLNALGYAVGSVKIIAVEQKPPHDVAVFDVTDEVLEAGEVLVRELLAGLKVCRRRGSWPGRYHGSQPLDFPRYALPDAGEDYGIGGEIEIITEQDSTGG